jgi:hypothetical protein
LNWQADCSAILEIGNRLTVRIIFKEGDAMTEREKKVSKYGRPIGRPPGKRNSDLKRTILAIMSRYRIPELVWRDLEAARKDMTPKERFQASVVLAELGLKASPKDLNVTNASTFSLVINGLGQRQTLIAEGEIIESGALPHIPAREAGDAKQIRQLLPPAPAIVAPPIDDRRQKTIRAEQHRPEDLPPRRDIGLG